MLFYTLTQGHIDDISRLFADFCADVFTDAYDVAEGPHPHGLTIVGFWMQDPTMEDKMRRPMMLLVRGRKQ